MALLRFTPLYKRGVSVGRCSIVAMNEVIASVIPPLIVSVQGLSGQAKTRNLILTARSWLPPVRTVEG